MDAYHFFKQTLGFDSKALVHLVSGFLAEVVSGVLWLPIDVTKERMQVKRTAGFSYTGSFNAISAILQSEGWRGLYRGS